MSNEIIIEIPDNWEDLSDQEQDQFVEQLLRAVTVQGT